MATDPGTETKTKLKLDPPEALQAVPIAEAAGLVPLKAEETTELDKRVGQFVDELAGFYNPEISASDPVTALRIALRERGYEHAIEVFNELKRKNPQFEPLERDLNDWGYRMLNGGGKPKEALEIFKLNVYLYPSSANVYDSVAEAYAANGQRALAIQNYKRSLELDPKNTNAVQQLKKLDPNFK